MCEKCKCGVPETQKQLRAEGWLIARKRDAPKGELVIRCPDCRTVHSERLAEGFTPEPIFDIADIQRQFSEAEPYDSLDSDEPLVSVFLGAVLNLYPSGKYYMPFASGNVSEVEAEEDLAWCMQAESELDSIGAWLEPGEGDPLDLFATREDTPLDPSKGEPLDP